MKMRTPRRVNIWNKIGSIHSPRWFVQGLLYIKKKKNKKQKNSCFISKITLFGDLFIITDEIDLSQFVQFVGAYNLLQKQA